jgi:hypothetical protein
MASKKPLVCTPKRVTIKRKNGKVTTFMAVPKGCKRPAKKAGA